MLHIQLKPSVLYSLADTIPNTFLPLLILILIAFLCMLLHLYHPDLCVPINNKQLPYLETLHKWHTTYILLQLASHPPVQQCIFEVYPH